MELEISPSTAYFVDLVRGSPNDREDSSLGIHLVRLSSCLSSGHCRLLCQLLRLQLNPKISIAHSSASSVKILTKRWALAVAQPSAIKKRMAKLLAETEALRQKILRLVAENQRLKAKLSRSQPASSLDKDEKRILVVINREGQALVRDIARRLRFHPTKVDRLLENLEFEGHVQARLTTEGTFYTLKSRGRKYLTVK